MRRVRRNDSPLAVTRTESKPSCRSAPAGPRKEGKQTCEYVLLSDIEKMVLCSSVVLHSRNAPVFVSGFGKQVSVSIISGGDSRSSVNMVLSGRNAYRRLYGFLIPRTSTRQNWRSGTNEVPARFWVLFARGKKNLALGAKPLYDYIRSDGPYQGHQIGGLHRHLIADLPGGDHHGVIVQTALVENGGEELLHAHRRAAAVDIAREG